MRIKSKSEILNEILRNSKFVNEDSRNSFIEGFDIAFKIQKEIDELLELEKLSYSFNVNEERLQELKKSYTTKVIVF